jgi:hypothetical protein
MRVEVSEFREGPERFFQPMVCRMRPQQMPFFVYMEVDDPEPRSPIIDWATYLRLLGSKYAPQT